jgi:hypothetical protein
MTTLNIKIVGVEGDSVLVKYASENSAKTIDEYPAVAYQPKAMGYGSLDDFIEGIKPGLISQVVIRDKQEQIPEDLDLSAWHGHESEHEYTHVVDSLTTQLPPALENSEILL